MKILPDALKRGNPITENIVDLEEKNKFFT